MRRLFLILALLLSPAAAQVVGPGFVDYVTSAPSGTCSQGQHLQVVLGSGDIYTCQSGTWTKSGGSGVGTVTSIATTSPITGGTITTTGTIACATCVVASSPGVGLAHFAGSTQTVTSSAVNLAGADVTGQLPIGNVGSAGLSGTSPMAIASTGAISCATCVTSAASLTSHGVMVGAGSQASATISASTTTTQALFATANDPAFRAIATADLPTTISYTLLTTATNCAATGTSANPSVVSCSAAPTGSFACATNASTGTCQVNTTAVNTASRIFIQPTAAANTLTCNATSDTGLTGPRLLSQSNGASFTINLGTFSTTAECFNYWIVN